MKLEIQNNAVLRDGQPIGIIHDGTCYSGEAIAGPIKGKIRQLPGMADLKFVTGDIPTPDEKAQGSKESTKPQGTPALSELSDDALAAEMKRRGLIQDAPPTQATQNAMVHPAVVTLGESILDSQVRLRDPSGLERLLALANEGAIPQPPPKNPMMGDKTPEYVAWVREHATDAEFNIQYPPNRTIPRSSAAFQQAEEARTNPRRKLAGEVDDEGNS